MANTLRLLKLPEQVRNLVTSGDLSAGHARALVTCKDPVALANRIVRDGLSVRQAEELGQERTEPSTRRAPETKSLNFKNADIRALEKQLSDTLGLKLDIRHQDTGKGEIRISYNTLDQLEEVCTRLRKR